MKIISPYYFKKFFLTIHHYWYHFDVLKQGGIMREKLIFLLIFSFSLFLPGQNKKNVIDVSGVSNLRKIVVKDVTEFYRNHPDRISEILSHKATTWAKAYGGNSADAANSIISTSDGYIVAGGTYSFGAGKQDFLVIKLDTNGGVTWAKTFGGSDLDKAYSVISTSDGYVVAGYTRSVGAGSADFLVIKLDTNGGITWVKTYGGRGSDYAKSIISTSDGYLVVGMTYSFGAGDYDLLAIKLDTNGEITWARTYGGSSDDRAYSITSTSDGYVVAGKTNSFGAGSDDLLVIKLDTNGDVTWTRTYGGSSNDIAYSATSTSDGYLIAGYTKSFGAGSDDFFVIKLDANGEVTWARTYGGGSDDTAYSITSTSDGYLVAGETYSFGAGSNDFLVINLDTNGGVTWARTYGGSSYERTYSIISTSDGYVAAGYTRSVGAGSNDFLVIKLDTNGNMENCTYLKNCSPTTKILNLAGETQTVSVNSPTLSTSTPTITTSSPNITETYICPIEANLNITKSDNPDPVIAGKNITYTITVNNSGPSDAENVVITDNLPSEIENPQYSTDGGNTWNNWSGSLNIGNLSSGASFQLLIRGTVNSSATGTTSNTASVSSDTDDPDTSNNSATENTTINTITDISLSVDVSKGKANSGDELTFNIAVRNTGTSSAENVVVYEVLLPGIFTYTSSTASKGSYDSGTGIWSVGNMDPGDVETLSVVVRFEGEGEYLNYVRAHTTTLESDYSNNEGEVDINGDGFVDIGISKSYSQVNTNSGYEFTYHIKARNLGNNDAHNVVVVDDLPGDVEVLNVSVSKGTYQNGRWEIGDLSSGEFADLDIDVRFNGSGRIINIVHLDGLDEADANNTNNSYSSVLNGNGNEADIGVDKWVNEEPALNRDVNFVIRVVNYGNNSTNGVIIRDVIPSVFTYISSNPSKGSYDEISGDWNVGNLTPGEVAVLVIRVRGDNMGSYTNVAEVRNLSGEDPDEYNNQKDISGELVGGDGELECSVNDICPYSGEDVNFIFTLRNNGPGTIQVARVRTNIPDGFSVIYYSGDGNFDEVSREWEINNLNVGNEVELLVECRETTGVSNHVECFNPELYHVEPEDIDSNNNSCKICIDMGKKSNSDVYINTSIDNVIPDVGSEVGINFQVGNLGQDPVYSLSGYIFFNGAVEFRGGGGYGVILNYPEFFIPELMAGESVGFTVNIVPLEERDYFYYGELNTDLINDGNLNNNEAPGRFSTRRIYHFIPGGGNSHSTGNKLDVNRDGKLSVVDLYKLLNIIVGNITPEDTSIYDINGDGKVNEGDALILKRYLSGEVY